MNLVSKLRKDLSYYRVSEKASFLPRFFKTGKGQYGEGDIFIGVTVPNTRIIAKKYWDLDLLDLKELLHSKIHEERLAALFILVDQFQKGQDEKKKLIYEFYIKNRKGVNNWDLVDSSASYIVGAYLLDKAKDILYEFAKSESLWDRRIAIISTHYFIRNHQYEDTIKIAKLLFSDKEDLIHKAAGWMLREVGKSDRKLLVDFLKKHHKNMPRTTLRYAIEHFSKSEQKEYIEGKSGK